ncbi:Anaphase-promoting complex subunit 4 [Chelonia mydas]|uniref:Anaphase-promoting complex subunit 4 n=1 Tax=Chelonia mydas TaxID=8469 RepID=M7BNV3_CHEMY|nr:Anaphase-promoting complex subunit 4 [Chelonia mydas]
MAWSPKRDLIALANKVGEVLLHRLANFQRVWSLPPNENTGKEVTALAWRPDGKILAFGLADTKRVILCDVEKPESLHSFSVDAPITYMHWMEVTEESSVLTSFYNAEDESNLLLPKLPALPKNYSTSAKIFSEEKSDEIMKLLGDVRLNALVLGGSSGFIEVYAYGMYKIATVTGVAGSCLGLCFSSDLKSLSVITEVQVSPDSVPEITYFQEKNTTTSVQDEFMQLLLWGKASLELQALLMNQLTVKGLKKLGQSIESSYSSIQKLVISHLQSGSEALLYHLSELKGMASWKQKYESLGLAGIEDAITAVGSFILKANELLHHAEDVRRSCSSRAEQGSSNFFRVDAFYNIAMLNLILKMTQKDITFVADFLTEHFNEAPELYNRKGKYFNVERVGQYLKDEDDDLVSPPNTEGNQWFNFLQNSTHLKESPLLFPYYPQKSLHFVKRRMEGIIDQCLQKPADVIGKSVHQAVRMPLYKGSKSEDSTPRLFKLPFMWNDKSSNLHYVLFTMLESSLSKIYILRRHTDVSRSAANGLLAVDFGNFLNNSINESSDTSFYSCIDAHFYDDETITVVLKENAEQEGKERILAQLPLSSVYVDEDQEREFSLNSSKRLDEQSDDIPTRTIFLESQWRVLENMKAQYVAVNGIRKVSCVLSSNLRHVRVFEMDVEDDGEAEEEEEEEETTQIVGGEHEELNLSAVNHSSVCGGSAELADETEEHESSLDS